MEKSSLNIRLKQDGNIIHVEGQTFPIKEELKAKRARWNPENKTWDFVNQDMETVQEIVDEIVEKRRKRKSEETYEETNESPKRKKIYKSPNRKNSIRNNSPHKREFEIKPYIEDGKELWNNLMDENKIKSQKPLLEGAGVMLKYYKLGTLKAEWYTIIEYMDPKLYPYADIVTQWFSDRGLEAKNEKGVESEY